MIDLTTTTGHLRVRYIKEYSLDSISFKPHFDFPEFVIPKKSFMKNKQKSNKNCSDKMIGSTKEFEINFWDLSDKVRLTFRDEFTKKLFDNCNTKLKDLAKKLDVSYPFVVHLRKNMYSIPVNIVLKLAKLSKTPIVEVQKNIISLKSRAGNGLTISLPIKPDYKLASLVGHVFGDGYVGKDRKYFEYSNNNLRLIKEVKKNIYDLFRISPTTEKETRITYPTIVGEILKSFGAPLAPKVNSINLIPSWVFESKENKIEFLKAFFDDDGSVMLSKNSHAKGLNLHITRYVWHKENGLKMLKQVSSLLKEFDITSGEPKVSRYYEKKDGKRVVCYINITNYRGLLNFYTIIGLTKGNKFSKLKKIVDRKFKTMDGSEKFVNKPKKVLVLGSGSLKIGEAGETFQ